MTRPLLALDVDGALSPLPRPDGTVDPTWDDVARVDSPFLLHLSRTLGDELAALGADRVWLTTWEHRANDVIVPHLGWEPLPVLTAPARLDGPLLRGQRWKAGALDAYLAEHDPPALVWVDDLLGQPGSDLRGEVDARLADDWLDTLPHLLIGPDEHVGLSPADLTRIRAFLATPS